jgi:peptidoglycan/xylan/chitin deacetylase (PgdA/CDA1 family)
MTLMTTLPAFLTIFSLVLLSASLLVYRPPLWLVAYSQRRYPDVLFYVPTDRKTLALTIDDGPSQWTSEIKRTLAAHNVKATFFLIGSNIPGREETLAELISDGHELANHAMHDEPSISLTSDELTRQIQVVDQQISKLYTSATTFPPQPKYFRPGSGFFNATIRRITKSFEYKLILGSIYPWDAQISWPRLNAWHILSSVQPGGIIVVHERKWTAEMLRILLPPLQSRGWTLTTVTGLVQHTLPAHPETDS